MNTKMLNDTNNDEMEIVESRPILMKHLEGRSIDKPQDMLEIEQSGGAKRRLANEIPLVLFLIIYFEHRESACIDYINDLLG